MHRPPQPPNDCEEAGITVTLPKPMTSNSRFPVTFLGGTWRESSQCAFLRRISGAMFTLYGCGPEPVLYGLVLLMLGIPVFVWQRRHA
jgi:hypothetical protein